MAEIGKNILKLRKAAGMSQEELGAKLGKTRSAVSQYENDVIIPRMGVIEDIAAIFGVSKSAILGERVNVASADAGYRILAPSEQELLALYRSMDPVGRASLIEQAEFLSARHQLNTEAETA